MGCFADTSERAIAPIEGYFNALHGAYTQRADAIGKCARSAAALGHRIFAVQNGGWCASAANAENTYKKYGASSACLNNGKGGPAANQVYEIEGVDKSELKGLWKFLMCYDTLVFQQSALNALVATGTQVPAPSRTWSL